MGIPRISTTPDEDISRDGGKTGRGGSLDTVTVLHADVAPNPHNVRVTDRGVSMRDWQRIMPLTQSHFVVVEESACAAMGMASRAAARIAEGICFMGNYNLNVGTTRCSVGLSGRRGAGAL